MKQTKASFEMLVAKCAAKACAQPPPPDNIECPLCNYGVACLQARTVKHLVEDVIYGGTQGYYRCYNCKQSFTTPTTDTFTIASYKK